MADQHQRPAARDDRGDTGARAPTHAERCRTLVQQARSATLCTLAREPDGFPYGSLVTIAMDGRGRPLFLLSTLAEHTQNLLARPQSSVLVSEPLSLHAQPLALGRVTILGLSSAVPKDEHAAARETFLAQQPSASYYVDFADFAFYRLEPSALRYVGGFGRMSWVAADDYRVAEPDPLAPASAGILAHMNDDHADSVLAGYRRMYRTLLAHGAALVAPDGPLARIGASRTRIILRSTQVYLSLLQRAVAPRFMRAGVDRSIELDVLRQPFTKYPDRHRLWPALCSELAALEALDVPIFEATRHGLGETKDKGGTVGGSDAGDIADFPHKLPCGFPIHSIPSLAVEFPKFLGMRGDPFRERRTRGDF